MAKNVSLSHHYAAGPDKVWAMMRDYPALAEMSRGLISFKGLPEGRMQPGDDLALEISLFNRMPWKPYRIRILEADDAARSFLSDESGAGVALWRHRVRVLPDGDGAVLTDEVEIDAGRLTFLAVLWAHFIYNRRHPARLRMLGLS